MFKIHSQTYNLLLQSSHKWTMQDSCFCSVDKAVIISQLSALALVLTAVSDKVKGKKHIPSLSHCPVLSLPHYSLTPGKINFSKSPQMYKYIKIRG